MRTFQPMFVATEDFEAVVGAERMTLKRGKTRVPSDHAVLDIASEKFEPYA
jgi:hypothetical protein